MARSITEIKNKEFFNELSKTWDSTNTASTSVLFDNLLINEGDKVLDVACGTGVLTKGIYSRCKCKVTGIDISEEMLERAVINNEGVDVEYINESFYNYTSDGYDIIIIYNAFPHFIDLDAFKEAVYRNLKSGGKFIICHSLSREELNMHHSPLTKDISRDLIEVKKEADFFKDLFIIDTAKEDDQSFVILGHKK